MAGTNQSRNMQPGAVVTGCFVAMMVFGQGPADAKSKSGATDNISGTLGTVRHIDHESPASSRDKTTKIASEVPMSVPVLANQDPLPKPTGKLLSATTEIIVKAPLPFVWKTLTDFSEYPSVFPKIETCKVTKQSGNYVYTESNLKPQLFLRQTRQTCVNDLTGKPHVLRWAMLEGNFSSSQGRWELAPENNGKHCKVRYTLESTTEPVPKALASMTLKFVQKDIVKSFKRTTEERYQTTHQAKAGNIAIKQ